MNKILTLLAFALSTTCTFAQQTYKYRAPLLRVDSDNFYRIQLDPLLLSKSMAYPADIRIFDQSAQPVPYIFGDQLPVKYQKNFIALPQISKAVETDTSTIFVAQNTGNYTISQLYLRLRNTAVERTVNISGSDDQKNWYAIKENIGLTEAGTSNGIFEQMLNFPSSTYRYFKVQINHKNHEPVAILQAGIYQNQSSQKPVYTPLEVRSFSQKENTKTTYITINLPQPFQVNKLVFDIIGSKFFKRDIRVYQLNGQTKTLLSDTVISSAATPALVISAKTKTLQVEISNNDNPPLNIKNIHAYQLNQSLIAYLQKSKKYFILVGDSTATTPDYDLKSFIDSLNQTLPVIAPRNIYPNPTHQITVTKKPANIPAWAIWIAIALVVGVLGFLTIKMTGEMNKRESN